MGKVESTIGNCFSKVLTAGLMTAAVSVLTGCDLLPKSPAATNPKANAAVSPVAKPVKSQEFDKNTEIFLRWRVNSEMTLNCLAQYQIVDGERSLVFRILDMEGNEIHREDLGRLGNIGRTYSVRALRQHTDVQLAIEYDDGGSMNFLDLYEYKDGKVRNLMKGSENNFDVTAEVRPFGSDKDILKQIKNPENHISKLPDRVFLTSKNAYSLPRKTVVFEYKDGMYQKIGYFWAGDIDETVSQQLRK